MTESHEIPMCDWCQNRPGVHHQKVTYPIGISQQGDLVIRTEIIHMCGECQHELDYSLAQRLSFVEGQGWTI